MYKLFLSRRGAESLKAERLNNRPFYADRRGFGLVEVMVAMAVIAIVAAAAITIVLSSLNSAQKTFDRERAEYFSADAVEAFRISEDSAEFEKVMEFAGYKLDKDGDEYIYRFENGYVAGIDIRFPAVGRPAMSVWVTDKNGNEVCRRAFEKGGA